jgi:hypothetical protein
MIGVAAIDELEAQFAEADRVIELSRQLTERARATRVSFPEDPFEPPSTEIISVQVDPENSPPKRR